MANIFPKDTSSEIEFFVNGRKVLHANPDPEQTLISFLRENLGLTGTKLGCSEGGCGACTVMLSSFDPTSDKVFHYSANACLVPVCGVDGLAVTTVEGIGSIASRVHPVQERIAKAYGSQCGFCTPGIVMSMYALLRNHPDPTLHQIESALGGNLCRCTGYRPILSAFKTFSKEATPNSLCPCGKSDGCCQKYPKETELVKRTMFNSQDFVPLDATQEPIFPPELKLRAKESTCGRYLKCSNGRVKWIRPCTLDQLLHLKAHSPHARLVVGNTELSIEHRLKNMNYVKFIHVGRIPDLLAITSTENGLVIGSSVTLSTFEALLRSNIASLPEAKTRFFRVALDCLKYFAGEQVRNVGCIGGNVVTACTISDLIPVLQASNSFLNAVSGKGTRRLAIREFYLSYRKTALNPDEVLLNVELPFSNENDFVETYKISKRKEDDLAIISACFHAKINLDSQTIDESCFSFGGVAPIPVISPKTQSAIRGRQWNRELLDSIQTSLASEHIISLSVPGGMPEYRRAIIQSLALKFHLFVLSMLPHQDVSSRETCAITKMERPMASGYQVFEAPLVNRGDGIDPVGMPKQHLTAMEQATGEAIYVDDIPPYTNELFGAIVYSSKAHANIVSVDPSKALEIPGVVDFITAKDVTGENHFGSIMHDEECYATSKVLCVGFPIGMIVANSTDLAHRAATLVKVVYEELPPIITIQEAIAAKSYFSEKSIIIGDVEAGFAKSDHVLSGELHMGGQEHFYLETQACICIPKNEQGEMEVISSTQALSHTQHAVAVVLGVPSNRIKCHVKRLGGGFGGKESRSMQVAVCTAVAAKKLRRPVRCILTRQEDMLSTGGRHPFHAKYKVGFASNGKILALEVDLYNNGGCSLDLSGAVMDRALFHSDSCYKIPNVKVTGHVCRTNLPSNTAFRGFGGPQGLFFAESWIGDVARTCGMSANAVRELNFYKEGDTTHFNQALVSNQIESVWKETKKLSDYDHRAEAAIKFNAEHKFLKRGVAMIPVKFGISYTAKFLNQAGALVHVYTDGSILVSHGGVEMGQGIHVKMAQVAARALGVPLEKIHISETSTATVANASASAASATADLNGMAVLNACEQIVARLAPYREKAHTGTFEEWVNAAYFDRINLSANGFYATPDLGYDFVTNSGRAFNYFTYGAACSEVELDVLTGESRIIRTDLVMDLGASLNPSIDIGQVEGAFVQGLGLFCMEQMIYSPNGKIFSVGPGAYKIPAFGDIPAIFNVSLLRNAPNERAIHSSKAVGEPPLFLGASVFFALKDAVIAARVENGHDSREIFRLDSPATVSRLRLATGDHIAQQAQSDSADPKERWDVEV